MKVIIFIYSLLFSAFFLFQDNSKFLGVYSNVLKGHSTGGIMYGSHSLQILANHKFEYNLETFHDKQLKKRVEGGVITGTWKVSGDLLILESVSDNYYREWVIKKSKLISNDEWKLKLKKE